MIDQLTMADLADLNTFSLAEAQRAGRMIETPSFASESPPPIAPEVTEEEWQRICAEQRAEVARYQTPFNPFR